MARAKAIPLPRFIEAASIDEGDVIRATWKVGDIEHTRTGRVAKIVNDMSTKQFISPGGNEICRVTSSSRIRFTLLAEHEAPAPTLFDLVG